MKTLLQINSVYNFRSTGKIVEGIGELALLNGWKSFVAYGLVARPGKSEQVKIGNKWDVYLHGIKTRLFDQHGFGSCKATLLLIEKIKEIKPDIIHLHNIHNYYINIQVLFDYLKVANIPVVWTLHDCWSMTGHCYHFTRIGCEKWKTECHHCPQKKEYPASLFLDRSRKNHQQKKEIFTSVEKMEFVTVSSWLADTLKQSFFSGYNIRVINNGVDINVFKPQKDTQLIREKYKIGNRLMLFGVATSWNENKGIEDYYRLNERLNDDEVIVMVGLTEKQIKSLPKGIIGIQRTENLIELVALYSAADVVMNLSYEETFGLTTVEGFACGTPGIVYNCTASPELITKETGFIVEPGDINGIISSIQLIKEKGKIHYSKACRERAVRFYNKDDRYQDYVELYTGLLDKKITD